MKTPRSSFFFRQRYITADAFYKLLDWCHHYISKYRRIHFVNFAYPAQSVVQIISIIRRAAMSSTVEFAAHCLRPDLAMLRQTRCGYSLSLDRGLSQLLDEVRYFTMQYRTTHLGMLYKLAISLTSPKWTTCKEPVACWNLGLASIYTPLQVVEERRIIRRMPVMCLKPFRWTLTMWRN